MQKYQDALVLMAKRSLERQERAKKLLEEVLAHPLCAAVASSNAGNHDQGQMVRLRYARRHLHASTSLLSFQSPAPVICTSRLVCS